MTNSVTSQAETDETPLKRPYHALKAIPNIDRLILDAVGQGKSLKSIADEYGVDDTAILRRCQQYPEYRDKLEIGIELRMDKREEELELADTNVSVTRADRLLGHARWLAERTAPQRFGQQTKLTGSDGGPIQVEIVRYGATIEGQIVDKSVDK